MITILMSSLILIGLCNFDQRDLSWQASELAKDELDKLTRLLCEAGKVYRGEKEPSKKLKKWWKKHKKKDKKKGR